MPPHKQGPHACFYPFAPKLMLAEYCLTVTSRVGAGRLQQIPSGGVLLQPMRRPTIGTRMPYFDAVDAVSTQAIQIVGAL